MARKRYTSEFKSKVVLEALKEQKTISEISSKYGVHPNQITRWKKQLQDGLKEIFTSGRSGSSRKDEKLQDKLYQEIGRLKVELDWLKKKI